MVIKCAECGTESPLNIECEYCHKTFCEKHMPEHKAWEHRHDNLAEDSSRLWKRRRESPYKHRSILKAESARLSTLRERLLESANPLQTHVCKLGPPIRRKDRPREQADTHTDRILPETPQEYRRELQGVLGSRSLRTRLVQKMGQDPRRLQSST